MIYKLKRHTSNELICIYVKSLDSLISMTVYIVTVTNLVCSDVVKENKIATTTTTLTNYNRRYLTTEKF